MTLLDAVFIRTSQRRYLPTPIDPAQQLQLQKTIDQCCRRSGLHIQLICSRPEPFASFVSTYGMLSGVRNYIVLAGSKDDPHLEEKCGYYGEEIVLTATSMGLGTCWVGGTFKKSACACHLTEGEKLVCVITIGHAAEMTTGRQSMIRKVVRRKSKTIQELSSGLEQAPSWFKSGMESVQRAPSAVNRQGVLFTVSPEGDITVSRTSNGPFSLVDLGIAKYHFELGAHGGTWTWGDNSCFQKAQEEKSCGAVIWRWGNCAHEYLLARHNGGHWSFPKGHVESDETEIETALREIREETGLLAEIDSGFRHLVTYYPKPNVVKDVVFFLATVTGGAEHAQEEEIAEIGWFSFDEARNNITYASDEAILLAAEKYLSNH